MKCNELIFVVSKFRNNLVCTYFKSSVKPLWAFFTPLEGGVLERGVHLPTEGKIFLEILVCILSTLLLWRSLCLQLPKFININQLYSFRQHQQGQ